MPNSHRLLLSVQSAGIDYSINRSLFKREKHTVLKNISFDVHAGDSLGVIGRNGAGKSSLLKLLAGVVAPDRGKVINYQAKVVLMALQVGFDNEISGRDNILLGGLLQGFDRVEIKSKLDAIISFSELGHFIDRPLKSYSAGMRARLGFSIGHILQAEVLLVDETLGVGDVEFRKKSSQAMKERIKSDQTVVLVSHDAATIKSLCNRAIWIENSVCQMIGDVNDVVDAYESYALSHPQPR